MRLRIPGPTIGLVIALGVAAGCGGEELFQPELGTNERLIETSAVARLASTQQGLEQALVVGDLDGDGIADAIIKTDFASYGPGGSGSSWEVRCTSSMAGVRSPGRSTSRRCPS